MTSECRQALAQQRREGYSRNTLQNAELQHSTHCQEIPSFDDPFIVNKITEFYYHLTTLEITKYLICSERFPNLKLNSTGSCRCCSTDKQILKVYSAVNT